MKAQIYDRAPAERAFIPRCFVPSLNGVLPDKIGSKTMTTDGIPPFKTEEEVRKR